jgi:hypothetical protein
VNLTLSDLTRAVFEPLLHARFGVRVGAQQLELELIEVKSLGAAQPPRREPFSLIFRGPRAPGFTQGTYPLAHPEIGEQQLFLVALGPDQTGMQYQAIFT